MAQSIKIIESLKAAAETGDINGLYESIKEDPNVLDRIDAIPFVDTPLHTAASAGQTNVAIEILRLKPSFGRKLNPDGLSFLHLALKNHKFDMVKRLVKLDKELIRVKGKEGETPLHFIAKKEVIKDGQQQRVLDIDRVNMLAEFLFACPDSIKDLTNRDETALHIAVKTKNQHAAKVILGFVHRINKHRVLASQDEEGNTALHIAVFNSQLQMVELLVKKSFADINAKNSKTQTALDIALLLDPSDDTKSIENTLRDAGALKGSSSDENDYILAEFLNSPERTLEVLYKGKFFMGRSVSMELRNMGLVVAVLIATATFQVVLSPLGWVGDGDFNLLTDGGNFNATITSTNTLVAANTSFINATLFIPSISLSNDVNFPDELTYGDIFLPFYELNTIAFISSTVMIILALPCIPMLFLLHSALLFMMMSYGFSFLLISPSYGYSQMYVTASTVFAGLVYIYTFRTFVIETFSKANGSMIRPFFMSKLQSERLMMLNHLLGKIE